MMMKSDKNNIFKEEILKRKFEKKIADIVGIKCYSNYTNLNNNIFMAKDLGISGATLHNIAECLEFQKSNYNRFINVQEIMFQVYIMHFIDIILSNYNRQNDNFGFILNKTNKGELIIINQGSFFNDSKYAIYPLSFEKAKNLDNTKYSKIIEFRSFISKVDPGLLVLFNYLFNIMKPSKIKTILNLIEIENNSKFLNQKELLKKYQKNYKELYNTFKDDKSLTRQKK